MRRVAWWVLVGWLVAAMARADPPPIRLSVARDGDAVACGSARALEAAVARRLGRDPFARDAERDIEVLVSRSEDAWRAHIYVRDAAGVAAGEREIASTEASCEALFESVALAIALSIDPDGVMHARAPEPEEELEPEPPAPVAPAVEVEAPAPVALAPPVVGSVSAALVAGLGLLPGVTFGPALHAQLVIAGPLRASAGLHFLPESRTSDGSFGFGLTAGWLGFCGALIEAPSFELSLCAEAHVGAIHAVVYEPLALTPTTPGDRIWFAPAAAIDAEIPVDDWTFGLHVQALFPATWYEFQIERTPPTPVFQEWMPSLALSVGIGRRFR